MFINNIFGYSLIHGILTTIYFRQSFFEKFDNIFICIVKCKIFIKLIFTDLWFTMRLWFVPLNNVTFSSHQM